MYEIVMDPEETDSLLDDNFDGENASSGNGNGIMQLERPPSLVANPLLGLFAPALLLPAVPTCKR